MTADCSRVLQGWKRLSDKRMKGGRGGGCGGQQVGPKRIVSWIYNELVVNVNSSCIRDIVVECHECNNNVLDTIKRVMEGVHCVAARVWII